MDLEHLGHQLLATLAFTGMGLVIFALAFWVMELITPFSIHKEIEEKQNMAVGLVLAAMVLGISLVIMGALLG